MKDILTKGANDRKAMRPLIDLKPSGNTFTSSSEGNQTVKSDDVEIYQSSISKERILKLKLNIFPIFASNCNSLEHSYTPAK